MYPKSKIFRNGTRKLKFTPKLDIINKFLRYIKNVLGINVFDDVYKYFLGIKLKRMAEFEVNFKILYTILQIS